MSSKKPSVSIEIDPAALGRYPDSYLMTVWHVAQANPVPLGDRAAGELTEKIGREIIRRWLRKVEPELWHHQGRDYYWNELRQLGTWQDGVFTPRAGTNADGGQSPEGQPS